MSNHKIDKETLKAAARTAVHTTPDGYKLEQGVSLKTVWVTTLSITALVLVSMVLVELMTDWKRLVKGFSAYTGSPTSPMSDKMPPYQGKPVLQVDEWKDLQDYLKAEHAQLDNYGWMDKNAGIVHVPIEVAIKRTAAKGLPARKGGQ